MFYCASGFAKFTRREFFPVLLIVLGVSTQTSSRRSEEAETFINRFFGSSWWIRHTLISCSGNNYRSVWARNFKNRIWPILGILGPLNRFMKVPTVKVKLIFFICYLHINSTIFIGKLKSTYTAHVNVASKLSILYFSSMIFPFQVILKRWIVFYHLGWNQFLLWSMLGENILIIRENTIILQILKKCIHFFQ